MKIKKEGQLNFFNLKNSLSLWIIGIFLLLIILVFPGAASAADITPSNLIERTNQEREKYGLEKLTVNELLQKAAEAKANDIMEQQNFSHNFTNKTFSRWIKEAGYEYLIVGENLAVNFNDSEPLFNAWLASPSHKKNILHEDYREIAVAAVEGNWFGETTTIVVELFGSPAPVLSAAASMEQLVPSLVSGVMEPAARSESPYFSASNLSEYYLNSAAAKDIQPIFNPADKIKVNNAAKDKAAVISYFLTAAKIMLLYMSLMLMMLLIYLYAGTLISFNKKLHLIGKP